MSPCATQGSRSRRTRGVALRGRLPQQSELIFRPACKYRGALPRLIAAGLHTLPHQPLKPPPRVIRAESAPAVASGQAIPPTRTSPTTACTPDQPSQRPNGDRPGSTPPPWPDPGPGQQVGDVVVVQPDQRKPAPAARAACVLSSPPRTGRWSARTSSTCGPQRGSHGPWPAATEGSTDIPLARPLTFSLRSTPAPIAK